jgi:hypothetical protein
VEAENKEPQQSKYWTVNRKAEEWLAEYLRSLKLNRSVCGTLSYLVHLADLPEIVYCSQKHDNNPGTQHEHGLTIAVNSRFPRDPSRSSRVACSTAVCQKREMPAC